MPIPNATEQHVNTLLTNVSVGFLQQPSNFIADKVFPPVPVAKKSDKYATFSRADFLRDEMEKRAPGAESAGGGYRVSSDTYDCDVYAFHKDVSDQERANADNPFNPDRDSANYLSQKRQIKADVDWVSRFFTTSVWGTDLTGGTDFTKWDDIASTPIEDITTQMSVIEAATGLLPNTLVLNRQGWFNGLKNHPDVVDRIKHTSEGPVTTQLVARLLELDNIYVAAGVKTTSVEAAATTTTGYIAGKHALLCYAAPSPGLFVPSAGYQFYWTGLTGSVAGQTISTFRLERNKSDRHEIEAAWDFKVVSSVLGAFFSGIVS